MGTAGLVGLLDAIQVMGNQYWIPLILIDVIAPAILTFSFYKAFRPNTGISFSEVAGTVAYT